MLNVELFALIEVAVPTGVIDPLDAKITGSLGLLTPELEAVSYRLFEETIYLPRAV
jgi:hypothetical protein